MTSDRKNKLLEQLRLDLTLLTNQNIMDYSLLLGVGEHMPLHKTKSHHQIMTEQDMKNQLS